MKVKDAFKRINELIFEIRKICCDQINDMNLIKNFLKDVAEVKKTVGNKKLFKVTLSKKQLDLLEFLAIIGVSEIQDFKGHIKEDLFINYKKVISGKRGRK